MDDEVDLSGVGLVAGLEGTSVEALITEPHLGDEDGEFLRGVDEQPHPGVAGPTVIARIQDVGTVQPGYPGHMLINEAAGEEGEDEERKQGFPPPTSSTPAEPWETGLAVPTVQREGAWKLDF